jgi:hypothetical protein
MLSLLLFVGLWVEADVSFCVLVGIGKREGQEFVVAACDDV